MILSGRDRVIRLEVGLLGVLTLVSAVLVRGSPSPGDGAIQMLAMAYQVAPFGLVLIIGRLGHCCSDKNLWQHTSFLTYLSGRFIGLLIVGLAILSAVGLEGSVAMAILGPFAFLPSLGENILFVMSMAAPSLVIVVGLFLWLREQQSSNHYYVLAMVISLIIAFIEYEIPVIEKWIPHIGFYNPFPGFLMSALALPSTLLGFSQIPLWLMINRLVWIVGGMGFFFITVIFRRGTRRYSHRNLGLVRWGMVIMTLGFCAGLAVLFRISQEVAPLSMSTPLHIGSTVRNDRVALHVNPSNGFVSGNSVVSFSHPVNGRLILALNHGLQLHSIFPVTRANSGEVFAGSAAAKWVLTLPRQTTTLRLSFSGYLLPRPTPLKYPPFIPGRIYEHLYVGVSRVFLQTHGFWYPRLLQITHHGAVTISRLSRLTLFEPTYQRLSVPITDMEIQGVKTWTYVPKQGPLFFLQAPYRIDRQKGLEVFGPHPLSELTRRSFRIYQGAWSRLDPWLFGARKPLVVIYSPVTLHPLLWQRVLIVSDVHPYGLPADPVTGSSKIPTSLQSTITLDHLWWEHRPRSLIMQYDTILVAYRHSPLVTVLLSEVKRGHITGLPSLTLADRNRILQQWRHLSHEPVREWFRFARIKRHGDLS